MTWQIVETYPYERLSHAVLAWVDANLHRCDVIHGHEWGGVFVDLATVLHLRQARPGALSQFLEGYCCCHCCAAAHGL